MGTIGQLAAGAAPPIVPGRLFRETEEIDELKWRFSSDSITLEEYLSRVSDTHKCMTSFIVHISVSRQNETILVHHASFVQ